MKISLRLKRQRSRIGFAAAQTSASWNQTENIKVSPGSADNSLESVQMHLDHPGVPRKHQTHKRHCGGSRSTLWS